MADSLIVTLPLPPNIANSRLHWTAKNRGRSQYFDLCDSWYEVRRSPDMHRIDDAPIPAIEHCTLSFGLWLGQRMDQDNLLSRCKWPIDWLRSARYRKGQLIKPRYFVDDSDRYCSMSIPVQHITRKRQDQKLVITITPGLVFKPGNVVEEYVKLCVSQGEREGEDRVFTDPLTQY